jgi:hypothetical protein
MTRPAPKRSSAPWILNAAVFAAVLAAGIFSRAPASAADEARFGPIDLGGRFEYDLLVDGQPDPYAWNASTHAATNRSRIMIDLLAPSKSYGSLYLKAAASWLAVEGDDVQKRLRFEQGDYLYAGARDKLDLSVRLFANERRFSVFDWTTPLVSDETPAANAENGGVRVDAEFSKKLGVTALFSVLDAAGDDTRSASYVKTQYSGRGAALSASYLAEDPGASGVRNHAVFKTELAGVYKRLFATVSYQQSGFDDSRVFFPAGSFDWGAYDWKNFSAVLPPGGAALAELRLASLPATRRGALDLVWRYDAVREEFVGDLGGMGASGVGQTVGAYLTARDVSLNARALYHTGTRRVLEDEKREWFDADLWAALKNGMECLLRGGAGDIDGGPVALVRENYIHGAIRHRAKRVTAGAHAMAYDLGTVYSGTRYAVEGKLVVTSEWGFYWRVIFARDYAASRSALFRLDFRPSERIYASLAYGEPLVGDDPFVVEDREIGLMRGGPARYSVSLRGDF